MTPEHRLYETDFAVIGTGLAGLAASIFANDRGLSTMLVGNTGAMAYTTGYLDLMGVSVDGLIEDPWAALENLKHQAPDHPLTRLDALEIRAAFERFVTVLGEFGIAYSAPQDSNLTALLPAGATKPTMSVPHTMRAGCDAWQTRAPTVIVGIEGLQGFSASEFVANLKPFWPTLTALTLGFPDMEGGAQVFAETMARALEVEAIRAQFAQRLKPIAASNTFIGLPAMLGIHKPDFVHGEMERLLGTRIFEIPTMPPSVAGIRLREMMDAALPQRGIGLMSQNKVERLSFDEKGAHLFFNDSFGTVEISARAALLASGRFLSGGLSAEQGHIRESLCGVPVIQPDGRDGWYNKAYLSSDGHPINRAGVVVDDSFRPLAANGEVINPRFFAAGSILAHQDWALERSGAGIAIASAYGAIDSVFEILE